MTGTETTTEPAAVAGAVAVAARSDFSETPVLEAINIAKFFGATTALSDVSLKAWKGKVTALLGDNGAGKSTLIKVLSGVHRPDKGQLLFNGKEVNMKSPKEARDMGIATCFQDLAVCDMMSITRNIILGQEPLKGIGPLKWLDAKKADQIATEALEKLGFRLGSRLGARAVTLSGGEKQSLAIARATYFGSTCLILDEPTAALAVRQASRVLGHIEAARDAGNAVVFITHNLKHAFAIADHFVVLARGQVMGQFHRDEVTDDELAEIVSRG